MQQPTWQSAFVPQSRDAASDTETIQSPDGFARLVTKQREAAYRVAYRYLRQEQDAEDVVQEAALRAWAGRATFRGNGTFDAWFLSIVRYTACDALRQGSHRPQRVLAPEAERRALAVLPDYAPSPELQAEQHETRQALLSDIQTLPEDYRQALLLRYWGGLSYQEVAERVGVEMPVVRQRLFRARTLLRKHLAEIRVESAEGGGPLCQPLKSHQ